MSATRCISRSPPIIGGQALIFESAAVLWWLVAFGVLVFTFVTAYEQPTLRQTYGASYEAYCERYRGGGRGSRRGGDDVPPFGTVGPGCLAQLGWGS